MIEKKRPKWYYAYFALALFNVVTVMSGLFVNHKIIDIYQTATVENATWGTYQDELAKLSEYALLVNAPGNDVFETKDPVKEAATYAVAYNKLINQFEVSEKLLLADQKKVISKTIVNKIEDAQISLALLDSEVKLVLSEYAKGNFRVAASHMSLMDRNYAVLASDINQSLNMARDRQHLFFVEQSELAEKLKFIEWVIGSLVFVMVIGAIIYGNILRKRIKLDEKEKDSLVLEAEESALALIAAKEDAEKQQREAIKANEAKGVFLASMSHEIRTPLNGILGTASLLAGTPLNEAQKNKLKTIETCSDSLLEIINEILDFSKIEAGEMSLEASPCNLWEAIQDVANLLAPKVTGKALDFECNYPKEINPYVYCDVGRVRQIVMNLVGNAIKFTDEGSIEIRVEEVASSEKGVNLRISVVDTGIGIPLDKQADVFARFAQTDTSSIRKTTGTGLGLAICKSLVQMMGGEIGLDSKKGLGSVFWFEVTFPFVEENEIAILLAELDKKIEKDVCFHANVLLVDDIHANQLVAEGILEMLGCRVNVASNGIEAVAMSKERKYDIIFMDCHMPEMDGYEATQAIRAEEIEGEHTTIVALTANAMVDDRTKCLEAGMDDYITKPIKKEQLSAVMQKCNVPLGVVAQESYGGYDAKIEFNDGVIQEDAFNDLRALLGDKFGMIINATIQDIIKLMEDIKRGIEMNDSDAVKMAAHSLKSVSAQPGAMNLSDMAAQMELAAIEEKINHAGDVYIKAQEECKEVIRQLKVA